MNETNNRLTIVSGTTTTSGTATTNGYSVVTTTNITNMPDGALLAISGNSIINYSSLTIANSNNMRTKQVKAAVFTIERNDKNEIVSTKFVKELWVEVKNGTSLDLIVAKELKGDFDPETTVVREILTVSF